MSSLPAEHPVLRVAWWNTGLAPPTSKRAGKASGSDGARWNLARETVRSLLEQADLLLLGEVDSEDAFSLCPSDFVPAEAVTTSKIGALFNPRRVSLHDPQKISVKKRGRELRILHVTLRHVEVDDSLEILALHFPSRLRDEHQELREVFASDLSGQISTLRNKNDKDAHLMVIGDFNDEPFSHAMQRQLRGVRERALVHADSERELLYTRFGANWANVNLQARDRPRSARRARSSTPRTPESRETAGTPTTSCS